MERPDRSDPGDAGSPPPNVLVDRPAVVERLLARKHDRLYQLAAAHGPRSVIELGPGEGFVARAAREDPGVDRYAAIDGNQAVVDNLQTQGFDAVVARVPPLPAGLAPADLVYASHLIEHLPDTRAVEEFLRGSHELLAPGGVLALVFPDARELGPFFWDSDVTHQWPSTPRRVRQVAAATGWRVVDEVDMVLHLRGAAAAAGRLAYRLYPKRLLPRLDPARTDFWERGGLVLAPDVLVRLVPA